MSSITTHSNSLESTNKEPLLIAATLWNSSKNNLSEILNINNHKYSNPIKELYRFFSWQKEKIINQKIQSNSYLYSLIEPIYENYTSWAKKRSIKDKEIDEKLTQYFQTHHDINRIMQHKNAYIETGESIINSLYQEQENKNDYNNYIVNSRNKMLDLSIILMEIYTICQNKK